MSLRPGRGIRARHGFRYGPRTTDSDQRTGIGDHVWVEPTEISRREAEVLSAVRERLTNAEIALRLHISVRTGGKPGGR
jgi:DNA-binding NarL/FixJ family response regulator